MGVAAAAVFGVLGATAAALSRSTKRTQAPPVSTAPKEELEEEQEAIDKINEPGQTDAARKRVQAIRNVGGIRGAEVASVGSGRRDTLFGN